MNICVTGVIEDVSWDVLLSADVFDVDNVEILVAEKDEDTVLVCIVELVSLDCVEVVVEVIVWLVVSLIIEGCVLGTSVVVVVSPSSNPIFSLNSNPLRPNSSKADVFIVFTAFLVAFFSSFNVELSDSCSANEAAPLGL